jgi:dTDP-4-dehydrorhamnose 3,5-epimerase
MIVRETPFAGVRLIEPAVFRDPRGLFFETYQQERYQTHGIPEGFVQDNLSVSVYGTLRGLHFQIRHPQAKLVQVPAGEVYDVVVDVRPGSSTFGRWAGFYLSDRNKHQLFIPAGFAHGFCVLSDFACFMYKCSDYYHPEDEGGIVWSDPLLAIQWPIARPLVSTKDQELPCLADLDAAGLPQNCAVTP